MPERGENSMAENSLKQVKISWRVIEKLGPFTTTRLEIKWEDQVIGYYRIYDDPDTNNIAFYGENGNSDKHGVLPPKEYNAQPNNHKLIRYIEKDLEKMGYFIPDAHKMVSDYMLTGKEKFPAVWDSMY